jgi:hypothetical protein
LEYGCYFAKTDTRKIWFDVEWRIQILIGLHI